MINTYAFEVITMDGETHWITNKNFHQNVAMLQVVASFENEIKSIEFMPESTFINRMSEDNTYIDTDMVDPCVNNVVYEDREFHHLGRDVRNVNPSPK